MGRPDRAPGLRKGLDAWRDRPFRGVSSPSGEFLPFGKIFHHALKTATSASALFAAPQVRESAPALGPVRALSQDGPPGPKSILEGLRMAKKLKKGKKLKASLSMTAKNR